MEGFGLGLAFLRRMKPICPTCSKSPSAPSESRKIVRFGYFRRKSDGQRIRRFWCSGCRKTFSRATFSDKFGQKKRHKNAMILKCLAGNVSQRETARILGVNRKTVARKKVFFGEREKKALAAWNASRAPAVEVEFDDLETFEHTKCKPLSVSLMVEYKTRRIIDFEVSQMPAKGRLAEISRKKYGWRADHRPQARQKLFTRVKPFIHPQAIIRSDSNPHYPEDLKRHFPQAQHETVLGGRGASTGQGELKKLRFDPIFSLNHTCAMLRAHICRLNRKTWCTTKRPDRLRAHLALYVMSHNRRISIA